MGSISVDFGFGGRWLMGLISFAIFIVLLLVSLLHLSWAFGLAWPAKTRVDLGAMVVGTPKGVPMPSSGLTVLVAIFIFGLGLAALWGANMFSLGRIDGLKIWVLPAIITVFSVRGATSYLPFGPLQSSAEPFRSLDRHYFAPLCLLLAAGYLTIFLSL